MKFDLQQSLRNLDIEVKPFGYGETKITPGLRGYSSHRWLAINPTERWPEMVTFHEMAHILRGDTVLPKNIQKFLDEHKIPSWEEFRMMEKFKRDKKRNYDIIETECHVTGIAACKITGTPFDLEREIDHLAGYTQGRRIPDEVFARAYKTAQKIAVAGKVYNREGAVA